MTDQGLYPAEMRFSAFATGLDDEIRGGIRPALWLLMGAVACLLLIACANVANLLLVRGDARVREMAVRSAVGASTDRLVRQLLTESVVLAVVGAGLGLAVAALGLRTLVALDPTSLPPLTPVRVDWTVVGFTVVVAVTTTLLFGLVPALRTLRVNLVESLREGSQQATAGAARQRLRGALVVAEVSLAVVLVIGAGLMGRSLAALGRVPLGFDPEGVLTMRLALPQARYDTPEKVVNFYRQLVERVRTLPGVEAAGVVRALPLATTIGDWGLDIDGYQESPGRDAKGDWQIVTDGAFEAMGARLVRGRWFTAADTSSVAAGDGRQRDDGPHLLAQRRGDRRPGRGRRRRHERDRQADPGRGRHRRRRAPQRRHRRVKEKFFVPHSQWHLVTNGNLIRNAFVVVRMPGNPLAAASPVRAIIRDLDPSLPVAAVRPMTDVVATALATPRLTGFLLGTFAAIASALAVIGLYGVLSYLVARRTHEIGIRMAMGADRGQVLGMIVRRGVALAAVGDRRRPGRRAGDVPAGAGPALRRDRHRSGHLRAGADRAAARGRRGQPRAGDAGGAGQPAGGAAVGVARRGLPVELWAARPSAGALSSPAARRAADDVSTTRRAELLSSASAGRRAPSAASPPSAARRSRRPRRGTSRWWPRRWAT